MIKDRLIVCIASAWDYDPTSKHHLMKVLSENNDILWVNYHGSRAPGINRIDLVDSFRALRRITRGSQRVSPSIVQTTPLVIPGAANWLLRGVHRRMLISQIRSAIRQILGDAEKPIQIWSFAPDVPYLVGAFDEECFVYYCVDEYRQFEGFDAKRIAEAEDALIDAADIVVTTSDPLLETKRLRRPDAVLVRHGVDFNHFEPARRETTSRPADLATIPRPTFGFFGLIHHWVDLAFLADVARLRPHYSFVLLGDAKVDVSCLSSLDNVHLLGRRPYDELPAYCAHFDAGMLLFTRTAMTRNINPIKMYEYLAAGLPVISTPLPEAKRFPEHIDVVDSPTAFAESCDRVVTLPKPDRESISQSVRNETWHAKAEYLSDLIEGKLHPILRSATMPVGRLGDARHTRTPRTVGIG